MIRRSETTWLVDGKLAFFEFLHEFEIESSDIAKATALRNRAGLLYLRARDYGLRGLTAAKKTIWCPGSRI